VKAILLAAGYGSRLRPLTNHLPKCLAPISGIPLIDIWIDKLVKSGINEIIINTHYMSEIVREYLQGHPYENYLRLSNEVEILGTAGTLRKHSQSIKNEVLVVHADNLTNFNLDEFISCARMRPINSPFVMLTFETDKPSSCGIVKVNDKNLLSGFYEKDKAFRGNIANAAIYILTREILDYLNANKSITDISTELIPKFLNRIYTHHFNGLHLDIGTLDAWRQAQKYQIKIANQKLILKRWADFIDKKPDINNYLEVLSDSRT